mgnify:CR=1 FL=1
MVEGLGLILFLKVSVLSIKTCFFWGDLFIWLYQFTISDTYTINKIKTILTVKEKIKLARKNVEASQGSVQGFMDITKPAQRHYTGSIALYMPTDIKVGYGADWSIEEAGFAGDIAADVQSEESLTSGDLVDYLGKTFLELSS